MPNITKEEKLKQKYQEYVEKCKSKNKEPDNYNAWLKKYKFKVNLGLATTGGALIASSNNLLNGRKTVYHGTSEENWEKIKNKGLTRDHGGKGGASTEIGNSKFEKNSTGKVHFTSDKKRATFYANLHSDETKKRHQEAKDYNDKLFQPYKKYFVMKDGKPVMKDGKPITTFHKTEEGRRALKKFNQLKWKPIMTKEDKENDKQVKKGGKRIKIRLQYGKFKDSEKDPDERKNTDSERRSDKFNIDPEEIVGSNVSLRRRMEYNRNARKVYAKNNKGKFAVGAAGTAIGGALAAKAAYNIIKDKRKAREAYEKYKDKGGKLSFKEFKREFLNECYFYIKS